jgi:hypothetical protein
MERMERMERKERKERKERNEKPVIQLYWRLIGCQLSHLKRCTSK